MKQKKTKRKKARPVDGPVLKTRAFRYAVRPVGQQLQAINHLRWMARRTWNALVWCQRHAFRRMDQRPLTRHELDSLKPKLDKLKSKSAKAAFWKKVRRVRAGEDMLVLKEWAELLLTSNKAGRAYEGMAGLTDEEKEIRIEANRRVKIEKMSADLRGPYAWCHRRRLATQYAILRVTRLYAARSLPLGGEIPGRKDIEAMHGLHGALIAKFRVASEQWAQGKRNAIHKKGPRDSVTIQAQVTAADTRPHLLDGVAHTNLSCLHTTLRDLETVYHYPIPPAGSVKQMALAIRSQRTFVIYSVELPARDVAWTPDPKLYVPDTVIGIDPGITPPMTWATLDGRHGTCEPDVCRTTRILAKLKRLQRHYDRQERANFPDCFAPDGTPKRGKRRPAPRPRMLEVKARIERLLQTLSDRRTEAYRLKAREHFSMADTVISGNWKFEPLKNKKGERGVRERNINRKGYDAALSIQRAIYKDYAERSTVPKKFILVDETMTTETCSACGSPSGPSGEDGLKIKVWTCAGCGRRWPRNVNAAINFAKKYTIQKNPVDSVP